MITIIFTVVLIYGIYSNFRMLAALSKYVFTDFSSTRHFLQYFFLANAIFLFWARKKAGWYLLVIANSYFLVGFGWFFYKYYTWKYVFKPLSPFSIAAGIFFFCGTLYVLCDPPVRGVYGVDKKKMGIVIFLGSFLALVLLAWQ
jgi:hypothetical protein